MNSNVEQGRSDKFTCGFSRIDSMGWTSGHAGKTHRRCGSGGHLTCDEPEAVHGCSCPKWISK